MSPLASVASANKGREWEQAKLAQGEVTCSDPQRGTATQPACCLQMGSGQLLRGGSASPTEEGSVPLPQGYSRAGGLCADPS